MALFAGVGWCVLVATLLSPAKLTKGAANTATVLGIAHLAFAISFGWPAYPPYYDSPMRRFWGASAFMAALCLCAMVIVGGVLGARRSQRRE
ncbi:hypothetical protein [Phenylobacterium terrae]|uniref:hypothetical protein n=1 Tax=Phenylobacterium terrae TaxID=2665495 RepID=UPI00366E3B21